MNACRLLLRIDEPVGFALPADFDPSRVRHALPDLSANKVEPACRAPIETEETGGALMVRLDTPEFDPVDKPYFVSERGSCAGSFVTAIRAGSTTTRALTERLGLPPRTVARRLSTLIERTLITPTHPTRSSRQSYRLVDPEET